MTKMKTVPTPHGTVNGLALEPTNKFAITSGQDKRLSIWNVNSGRHMRTYKSSAIQQELYKADVDPSGMYVACAAFDKTISIFDFFSGEMMAQVTGHSEVVTSVKFSLDGRHIISTGGDGCVMVWKLADSLVQAMQDRLVELYGEAVQKRESVLRRSASSIKKLKERENLQNLQQQLKEDAGAHDGLPQPHKKVPKRSSENESESRSQEAITAHAKANNISPGKQISAPIPSESPALPPDSGHSASNPVQIFAKAKKEDSSAPKAEKEESAILPPPAPNAGDEEAHGVVGVGKNKGKWNARAKQGYELFGRHVEAGGAGAAEQAEGGAMDNFTMELTAGGIAVELDDTDNTGNTGRDITNEQEQEQQQSLSSSNAGRLALTMEDGDDVIQGASSGEENDTDDTDDTDDTVSEDEDEDDGESLFKSKKVLSPEREGAGSPSARSEPFSSPPSFSRQTSGASAGNGEERERASIQALDELEQSALEMENWLEAKLRSESVLDEGVSLVLHDPRNRAATYAMDTNKTDFGSGSATDTDRHAHTRGEVSLSQSLSSQFFIRKDSLGSDPENNNNNNNSNANNNKANNKGAESDEEKAKAKEEDSLAHGASAGAGQQKNGQMQSKRRETESAVAQMKDRLRGMGLIQATVRATEDTDSGSGSESEADEEGLTEHRDRDRERERALDSLDFVDLANADTESDDENDENDEIDDKKSSFTAVQGTALPVNGNVNIRVGDEEDPGSGSGLGSGSGDSSLLDVSGGGHKEGEERSPKVAKRVVRRRRHDIEGRATPAKVNVMPPSPPGGLNAMKVNSSIESLQMLKQLKQMRLSGNNGSSRDTDQGSSIDIKIGGDSEVLAERERDPYINISNVSGHPSPKTKTNNKDLSSSATANSFAISAASTAEQQHGGSDSEEELHLELELDGSKGAKSSNSVSEGDGNSLVFELSLTGGLNIGHTKNNDDKDDDSTVTLDEDEGSDLHPAWDGDITSEEAENAIARTLAEVRHEAEGIKSKDKPGISTASASLMTISPQDQEELQSKLTEHTAVLQRLNQARDEAMRSYAELEQLKSGLTGLSTSFSVSASASSRFSDGATTGGTNALSSVNMIPSVATEGDSNASWTMQKSAEEAIVSTETILSEYRQSFAAFAPKASSSPKRSGLKAGTESTGSIKSGHISAPAPTYSGTDVSIIASSSSSLGDSQSQMGTSQGSWMRPEEDIEALLDKHSDRMMEKLMAKLAQNGGQLQLSPTKPEK